MFGSKYVSTFNPHTITWRWIIDLSIKAKIIKLLEENLRKYLHSLEVEHNFLESTKHEKKLINYKVLNFKTFVHQKILLRKWIKKL